MKRENKTQLMGRKKNDTPGKIDTLWLQTLVVLITYSHCEHQVALNPDLQQLTLIKRNNIFSSYIAKQTGMVAFIRNT